jgi:hypothetical protein
MSFVATPEDNQARRFRGSGQSADSFMSDQGSSNHRWSGAGRSSRQPSTLQPCDDRPPSRSTWSLFWRHSVCPGEDRKLMLSALLENHLWRGLLVVLTFILLFGAQIRQLIIPPSGDVACDVILMTTFVIFMADIMMRIDCEPTYFTCKCRRKNRDSEGGTCVENLGLGSFLFWCDLISTLTLLTEISFISKKGFSAVAYTIYLDQFGIPVSRLLGGYEWQLLSLSVRSPPPLSCCRSVGRYGSDQSSNTRQARPYAASDNLQDGSRRSIHPIRNCLEDFQQGQLVLASQSD